MADKGKGILLVISGPSGVGKGAICKELCRDNSRIKMSVSATTRAPRPGEKEGISYFYKTRDEFENMIANGEFLEYMQVFGSNYYGTPRAYVEEQLKYGNDIILEIDVNGALAVKRSGTECVMIFIAPPSMRELHKRLVGRSTENDEAVRRRFETASKEITAIMEYDYVIVNDVLNDAIEAVKSIILAEHHRVCRIADMSELIEGGKQL